jgi:peptidyl-Lys metalloendopeptidase
MISTLVAQAYNFTASGAASYDILARNTFYIVNADSTISTLLAKADSLTAKISGMLAVARPTLVKRATFNGCTPFEETSLLAAAEAAHIYATGAFAYARSHTSATPRYTTWFGAYTSARHSTVVSHFSAISGNQFLSFRFDCTCTDAGTFAYVYPNE